jgi:hypothetical protein
MMISMMLASSQAAYEPSAHYKAMEQFSVSSPSSITGQSSAITPTGKLWQQPLADAGNGSFTATSHDTLTEEAEHMRRHEALVRLLRSWDEEDEQEDEQERRETWEQLKRALDEDRLSDRKLFP